jgi:glycosyltransferase involved in cell wall biosynthesis
VIVVDSESEDKTVEIAEAAGARVIIQPFLGDGPQKRLAVPEAKNDWILTLDADERLEKDAADAIAQIDFSKTNIAYAFKLRNFVGKKWIRAAGFYPDYKTRLYNRTTAAFNTKKNHAGVTAQKIRKINGHLSHFTYKTYEDWVDQINRRTTRHAIEKHESKEISTPGKATRHAIAAFFQKTIIKGGILQGNDGFLVALTSAFRIYMKYIKLYEMQSAGMEPSDKSALKK